MRALSNTLLGLLGALVIWLLRRTVRPSTKARDPKLLQTRPPPIFAFWHGRQLPLLCWRYPEDLAVMVSHSRDGQLQARVLRHLGFEVVRGSESRDAVAGLRRILRAVKGGPGAPPRGAAFAVDGSRGPLHRVHPGILLLAQHCGRPIVPVGVAVRRRKILEKTWDRYQIPLPFTPAAVVLGAPVIVPPSGGREAREQIARHLEHTLHTLNQEAEAACAAPADAGAAIACPRCRRTAERAAPSAVEARSAISHRDPRRFMKGEKR